MRKISLMICLGLFIINPIITVGQEGKYGERQEREGLPYNVSLVSINTIDTQYSKKSESPYLCDDFLKTTFKTSSGEVLIDSMRYDIYNDEIEIKKADKIYVLYPPEEMYEVTFNDDILVYSKYLDNSKLNEGYFILESKGKYNLLIKKRMNLVENDENEKHKDSNQGILVPKRELIYVKIEDQPAIYFNNITEFTEEVPELENLVAYYMKSNSVFSKNTKSLKKLFDYINGF